MKNFVQISTIFILVLFNKIDIGTKFLISPEKLTKRLDRPQFGIARTLIAVIISRIKHVKVG